MLAEEELRSGRDKETFPVHPKELFGAVIGFSGLPAALVEKREVYARV